MLEPDFDPQPTAIQIGHCGHVCTCRAPRSGQTRATIVLRKIDVAGRPVRQIELCDRYTRIVVIVSGRAGLRFTIGATDAEGDERWPVTDVVQ